MKRINEKNINTPEYFDKMWVGDIKPFFDPTRMKALIRDVKDGDKVLDVGCGVYGACYYISQHTELDCDLYAIDISDEALRITKEMAWDVMCYKFDIYNLNSRPGYIIYDVLIAGEIIEHVENPKEFVDSLIRRCNPNGGRIAISTVDTNCENAKKLKYPEHLWEFTPEDLIGFFSEYGDVEYKTVGDYHFIYFKNTTKFIDKHYSDILFTEDKVS